MFFAVRTFLPRREFLLLLLRLLSARDRCSHKQTLHHPHLVRSSWGKERSQNRSFRDRSSSLAAAGGVRSLDSRPWRSDAMRYEMVLWTEGDGINAYGTLRSALPFMSWSCLVGLSDVPGCLSPITVRQSDYGDGMIWFSRSKYC